METILMAEDEDMVRALLTATLGADPRYRLLFAKNGDEALQLAREHLPGILFLDILMPKKDGYTVCEELRRDPATSNMKIVMLTALAEDLDRQRGFDAGADAYLTKPFSPTTLLQKVNELLPQNEPAL